MLSRPFFVHALSPVHSGTGHSAGLIDLPVARMRATGVPIIPGSSIKGVLRHVCHDEQRAEAHAAVFGPDHQHASEHAGALVVGDAVLLALPVRSFKGTFAWVSAPLLLRLAARDLELELPLPRFSSGATGALTCESCACIHEHRVYLEDLDLDARRDRAVDAWAKLLAPIASPGEDVFSKRFVVVDDETMSFLLETATQIDARVRIDDETGTVADGALWLEESLPPESLLLGLAAAEQSRRDGTSLSAKEVLDFALAGERVVQLGGKASVGRGRCRVVPRASEEGAR